MLLTVRSIDSIVERITERLSMLRSDDLRNLRAGPVIAAGGIKDGTVRAWVANNQLRLGDREGRESGNPRYELSDAARLTMMRFLVERLAMPAAPAVATTNAAFAHLSLLAEDELAAIDNPDEKPLGKRYMMLVDRVDGLHKPEIVEHSEAEQRDGGRGQILQVTIDLREIVRMARDRLVSELGHSISLLRHDFADAPSA